MLSLWGTFLSFCIPPILLIGLIRNPAGLEGDILMALLAVLAMVRMGIALAKMRIMHRRDRRQMHGLSLERQTAWKTDDPFHSMGIESPHQKYSFRPN